PWPDGGSDPGDPPRARSGGELLRYGPRLRRQPRLLRRSPRRAPARHLPGVEDPRPDPRRLVAAPRREPAPAADRPPRPVATPRLAHDAGHRTDLRPRRRTGGPGAGPRRGPRAVLGPDRPSRPGHPPGSHAAVRF